MFRNLFVQNRSGNLNKLYTEKCRLLKNTPYIFSFYVFRNVCRQNHGSDLASASSLYICIRSGSACVGVCVCVCLHVLCVDMFVCMLVGNVATSSVSGDTQDAEPKNHTGLEANIWRVGFEWQTNTTQRSFLTS